MVLVGVSYNGLASLVFFNQGERLIAQRYISDVPMPYVEPLSISLFRYHPWCLLQDSAPTHKAKVTPQWCEQHVPNFISWSDWPASSPDLNTMNYVWSRLESMVNTVNHPSVSDLKTALVKVWRVLHMEDVRMAVLSW